MRPQPLIAVQNVEASSADASAKLAREAAKWVLEN